ncbi:hypothetical protein ACFLYX_01130 [Chloroflexota bacterium]
MLDEQRNPPFDSPFSRVSFEGINKLPWSNDFLDEAIAMNLFLRVFKQREDAESFWNRKRELEATFLTQIPNFPELKHKLDVVLDVSKLGASRKESNQILSTITAIRLLSTLLVAPVWIIKDFKTLVSIAREPNAYQAQIELFQFQSRYRNEYKALGGTWEPKLARAVFSPFFIKKFFVTAAILIKYPYLPLLGYLKDLINLSFESGLKCWWLPILLTAEDQTKWSRSVSSAEKVERYTRDGILGPIFPRRAELIFKFIEDKNMSVEMFLHEWEMISMSGEEGRKILGIENAHTKDEILRTLGYRAAKKWEEDDFNMLFDRLFWRMRVEDVADKYKYPDYTAQRRTNALAKILHFDIPKAPHKKHRKK